MINPDQVVKMKRLGIILLGAVLSLELGARVISHTVYQKPFWDGRKYVPDEHQVWVLNPGYNGQWTSDFCLKVNSDGLIGPELNRPKDDNTIRIILLGSSVTFGLGCQSYDSTCFSLLSEILERRSSRTSYELMNASVPGHSSFNGMQFVEHKLEGLDADVLIIAYGWNDATKDIIPDKTPNKNWMIHGLATSGALTYSSVLQYLKFLHNYIQTIKPAQPKFLKESIPFRVPLNDFRANIVAIIRKCRQIGIKPVLLCEPHPHGLVNPPRIIIQHEQYLNVLRGISTEMDAPLADADSTMAVYPAGKFFDYQREEFSYPNSKGQLFMAQILADTMERSGYLE